MILQSFVARSKQVEVVNPRYEMLDQAPAALEAGEPPCLRRLKAAIA